MAPTPCISPTPTTSKMFSYSLNTCLFGPETAIIHINIALFFLYSFHFLLGTIIFPTCHLITHTCSVKKALFHAGPQLAIAWLQILQHIMMPIRAIMEYYSGPITENIGVEGYAWIVWQTN